jgi:Transposase DNA-binding
MGLPNPSSSAALLSFGLENFGSAQLGDKRRTDRLVKTADLIVQHPSGTLPDKLQSPAALEGLYRLAQQKKVTHAAVLQPHRDQTLQRMRDYSGTVLTIHDASELDYSGKKMLTKLGQIGNGKHRGYISHNTLAVGFETEEVLGLANQILFRRPRVPKKESRTKRRQRKSRESRLWKRGSEALGARPTDQRWVDVCDRGADVFEYLDHKHQRGECYVVRACQDRCIEVEQEGQSERTKLFAYAYTLPSFGQREVSVPARNGQPARKATVYVTAGALRLLPPRQPRGEHRRELLDVWVVLVKEIDPPAGMEPLEWVLLTNVAVDTWEEACIRIEWYRCRWIVEEFHKAIKTGCDIEALGFHKEERLEPVIALLSVVGVFLLQLRNWSRREDAKQRPAQEVVPLLWVQVLSQWRHQRTCSDWSVHDFFYALARLGGHQNRKGDGMPGWITIWRGWTKLQAMIAGASAAEAARCGEN